MVAKISTGGNMFGALAYNQNKVDSGEAKVLFSNRMLLGEDGNFSIGECMRSFEMQMPVQLSTKKPILHISINPHPEDVLWNKKNQQGRLLGIPLAHPGNGVLRVVAIDHRHIVAFEVIEVTCRQHGKGGFADPALLGGKGDIKGCFLVFHIVFVHY